MDCVVSELCYNGIILQRSYRRATNQTHFTSINISVTIYMGVSFQDYS